MRPVTIRFVLFLVVAIAWLGLTIQLVAFGVTRFELLVFVWIALSLLVIMSMLWRGWAFLHRDKHG